MDNLVLGIIIALGVLGLVLMCVALVHMKRNGGFERAMALTADDKWPLGRYSIGAALACLALANSVLPN